MFSKKSLLYLGKYFPRQYLDSFRCTHIHPMAPVALVARPGFMVRPATSPFPSVTLLYATCRSSRFLHLLHCPSMPYCRPYTRTSYWINHILVRSYNKSFWLTIACTFSTRNSWRKKVRRSLILCGFAYSAVAITTRGELASRQQPSRG